MVTPLEDHEEPLLRNKGISCDFAGNSKFLISTGSEYTQQYSNLYFTRLNMLKPRVISSAMAKWGSLESQPSLVSHVLNVQMGVICFIIGTVYVDMPKKPNILNELKKEDDAFLLPPREKYVSDEDQVLLEDEYGRIKIFGDVLKEQKLVTGMIVGLLGSENSDGEFNVVDVCYPSFDPQPTLRFKKTEESPWVALVSGLEFGSSHDIRHQLMSDFLNGEGSIKQDRELVRNISRLILCGNLLADMSSESNAKPKIKNKFGTEITVFDHVPIQIADDFLSSVGSAMPVDIAPGPFDPSPWFLPQQPIVSSIFKKSTSFNSLQMLTNPSQFNLNDISFVICSGQSLDDLYRFTDAEEGLELAELTLKSAHLCPTAPDTVWCHPFADKDPLVLTTRPHVYIFGNQPKFETKLLESESADGQLEKTRIILLPKFSKSGTLVLLNLGSLECKTVTFETMNE